MRKKELINKLDKLGIPRNSYCIGKHQYAFGPGLEKKDNLWISYEVGDRGEYYPLFYFTTEDEAYEHFYQRMADLKKKWDIARARIYIGDVLVIKIDPKNKKYFQLVASDSTQLNSDVIKVFSTIYPIDAKPDLSDRALTEIVSGEVEFYAHCNVDLGVEIRAWEKYRHVYEVGKTDHVLFRDTKDYYSKNKKQINVSDSWYVWRINDNNYTQVGKLEGENRKAEIGVIMSPESIVHRMRTGELDFEYPSFE